LLGKVVLIPEGDYVCGTIKLQGNLILKIKGNLIGSRDRNDYSPKNFLIGENISNLVIEGEGGKIMGEGEYFWNNPILKPLESNPEISDIRMLQLNHFLAKREKKDNRPSPFIRITGSKDILIRNLIIENSPGWTLSFELFNNGKIRDLIIHNNIRGGNVNGIDIVGTSNVNINNVLVSTADDGIVLKNPTSVPMSNIKIRNARISTTANGFKIMTETYSDINDVSFTDSEIITTEFFPGAISGVAIESVDGSHVSNIKVDNIMMNGVLGPLFIRLGNRNKYDTKDLMSRIDNIRISNIYCYNCQLPSIISGVMDKDSELTITNVLINNFDMQYLDNKEFLILLPSVPENPAVYQKVNIIPRAVNTREMIVIEG